MELEEYLAVGIELGKKTQQLIIGIMASFSSSEIQATQMILLLF